MAPGGGGGTWIAGDGDGGGSGGGVDAEQIAGIDGARGKTQGEPQFRVQIHGGNDVRNDLRLPNHLLRDGGLRCSGGGARQQQRSSGDQDCVLHHNCSDPTPR